MVNIPSPNLFPFLSKRLLIPITKIIRKGSFGAFPKQEPIWLALHTLDKDDEAETASAMLTLQCNDDIITPDVMDSK